MSTSQKSYETVQRQIQTHFPNNKQYKKFVDTFQLFTKGIIKSCDRKPVRKIDRQLVNKHVETFKKNTPEGVSGEEISRRF